MSQEDTQADPVPQAAPVPQAPQPFTGQEIMLPRMTTVPGGIPPLATDVRISPFSSSGVLLPGPDVTRRPPLSPVRTG